MSSFTKEHTIYLCHDYVVNWNSTVPCSFVENPPSDGDDALEVRFIFCKGAQHALGPKVDSGNAVVESFVIPISEKVITIRPSELCGKDTSSIMQSNSLRLIADLINTHYPPPPKAERMLSKMVVEIIKLVRNAIGFGPLPPNRVIDVHRCETVQILHHISDEAMKLDAISCFEDTRRGTCVICMDEFEVGKDGSRLPCMHVFHDGCIAKWLVINRQCPLCRYSVPPKVATWYFGTRTQLACAPRDWDVHSSI